MTSRDRHLVAYLMISNFLMAFGYRIWEATFNNFAVEEMDVGPAGIGIIQAVREVPGLIGFAVALLSLIISEVRIMALSISVLGVGIIMTGESLSIPVLMVSTVVMSMGFHFFHPSSNAVVLMVVGEQNAPKRIGQLRSLSAFAALSATGLVFLFAESWGLRKLYVIVGMGVTFAGIILMLHGGPKEALPTHRRVRFRRRYWLFYTLAFLMGSRRHIFTTFAIFLLVREYGISVQTTATLFLINALLNVYSMQRIGILIGRIGERTMLSIAFSTLCFVFLGYAFIKSIAILYVLFVLDNILFGFNMALPTYFQKIALTREEITSNISFQQTINHVSAIIVPIVGGAVWELFGSEAPFLIGFCIVFISLILTQFMRVPESRIGHVHGSQ